METFSALLAIYAGNSLVTGEFPAQRPVTRSFEYVFDLHLNKQLRLVIWDAITPIMTSLQWLLMFWGAESWPLDPYIWYFINVTKSNQSFLMQEIPKMLTSCGFNSLLI